MGTRFVWKNESEANSVIRCHVHDMMSSVIEDSGALALFQAGSILLSALYITTVLYSYIQYEHVYAMPTQF